MSITYSLIAVVSSLANGRVPDVSYVPGGPGVSSANL